MSGTYSRTTLIGHLGGDPVRRSTQHGGDVVSFSIATSERWNDRDGNRQERTEWHRIVIFNEALGKIAMEYLRKGSLCMIEGQNQTRSYDDRDGIKRSSTEVVLQKFRGELRLLDRGQADAADQRRNDEARGQREAPPLDDDVPF